MMTIDKTWSARPPSARSASATLVSGPSVSSVTPCSIASPSSSTAVGDPGSGTFRGTRTPHPASAASRQSTGNSWVPTSGVDRPQATGTSSSPVRANTARTTPSPAGQRTSPVPETVTASTSTSSDDSRNASATRSSIARSVSTTTGVGEPGGTADAVVVGAASSPPHPATEIASAAITTKRTPRRTSITASSNMVPRAAFSRLPTPRSLHQPSPARVDGYLRRAASGLDARDGEAATELAGEHPGLGCVAECGDEQTGCRVGREHECLIR